ncbi:endoplasmic reticulum membrane-associated RNA degradation protein-like isoform X2 [Montipora capricornis]|uniref:endoplasmic reticulum membrane-associated RNA degradation protein-like isoform X2 n=1 Tax=Montipora capricornis TaxID=246305 RepID=UPI0035F133C0
MIQSFWHGKSLQKIYNTGKAPPKSLTDKFEDYMQHSGSSLSATVHKLICELSILPDTASTVYGVSSKEFDFTSHKVQFLDRNLWRKIESVLGEEIVRNSAKIDYCEAIRRLRPLCHAIHQEINDLEPHKFEEQYQESLWWTGCHKRFLQCFGLLKSSNPSDHILCLLLLTSSLEHSLGDIYLSYSDSSHCPSLLKDLLATSELKDVFGETVIRLLCILIGPPSSLNLRNVLWHGFAAPGEVPLQYASLLLVITASMSSKLEDVPFCSRKIKRRPLQELCTFAEEHLSVFPLLNTSDMPAVFELFNASFFIIPSMLPLWLLAMDYFCQKRFDLCIILLLPQLEHGLRRVFACVNNCPHRVLTAESTVLYTTFDEILSPLLQDGSENLLRQEIGDSYLEMLLDVLVHPEGPRIRDHISHGEVDLSEISQELANHILCICIAFTGLYILPDKNMCDCIDPDPFPIKGRICAAVETYKPLFHPVSLLTGSVHKVVLTFLNWSNLPKPLEEEFDKLTSSQCDEKWIDHLAITKAFQKLMASVSLSMEGAHKLYHCKLGLHQVNVFVEFFSDILNAAKFPTLYRPKDELTIIALLRSIIQHAKVTSEQICEATKVRYEQWKSRQLRQRQRANLKRLWSQIPSLLITLQLMVCVVIREMFELSKGTEGQGKSVLIRFLKRCLQCSENMESLSSTSKNRWDECSTAGKTWLEYVEQFYINYQ